MGHYHQGKQDPVKSLLFGTVAADDSVFTGLKCAWRTAQYSNLNRQLCVCACAVQRVVSDGASVSKFDKMLQVSVRVISYTAGMCMHVHTVYSL